MTTYFALNNGTKPVTMLASITGSDSLTYRRWDLEAKKWVDDSRVSGYINGAGGFKDVDQLTTAGAETLAGKLGVKLPA